MIENPLQHECEEIDRMSDKVSTDLSIVKCKISDQIAAIKANTPSRALSIAVTKLDEATMWIDEHLRLS